MGESSKFVVQQIRNHEKQVYFWDEIQQEGVRKKIEVLEC